MNTRRSRSTQFVQSVYENEFNDYLLIHHWLDTQFPEPAWRRKRQPIDERLELKLFAVMAYLCNYDDLLLRYYEKLNGRKEKEYMHYYYYYYYYY